MELLNPMSFYLYNRSLNIRESIENPSKIQPPKWELTWECGGSFFHTLLHSQEHEMWLPGFTLGLHFCKPLFWLRTQS
jgi:hypothetical protein